MNLQEQLYLSDEQYGFLFDIRRSVRYHDRRRSFYEKLHSLTSLLTILLAGSFLFDLAKPGETAPWLVWVSASAALLAAIDLVIGYSKQANLHSRLRHKFAELEISIVTGKAEDGDAWEDYQRQRLLIEIDEPPIYKVLDLLCRNELLEAQGFTRKEFPEQFYNVKWWNIWGHLQCLTSQFIHWKNVSTN